MSNTQLIPQNESMQCVSNIIAVASGKGGVGKTWFSITLAMLLAKKGKKVLLFDGDLGLANIDIQLGISPVKDLAHYIEDECELIDIILNYSNNFDIIVGRSGCGSLAILSSKRLEDLKMSLYALSQQYDYLILDLGAGLEGTIRHLSPLAGKTFLITTDEPTAITDAYAYLKYIHSNYPEADLQIVVNQSASDRVGLRTYETLKIVSQNFLKYEPKLAGILLSDKNVQETIRNQQPLIKRFPAATVLKGFEGLLKDF